LIATSSLYGESLLSFTEQFQTFEYFDMVPNINDNYTVIPTSGFNGTNANSYVTINGTAPTGTYLAIFQNSQTEVKDNNGNLVTKNCLYMWCEEDLKLGAFVFVFNQTFRIVPSNDWGYYGGFTQYEIDRLVGSNGGTQIDSGFSDGAVNFK